MVQSEFETERKRDLEWVNANYPTWAKHVKLLYNLLENYRIAAAYLRNKGPADMEKMMKRVCETLTTSVLQPAQIGGIIVGSAANNGFTPQYLDKGQPEFNFSRDDRTVFRTYIAVKYPCIQGEDAERWIDGVFKNLIRSRRDAKNAWGISDGEIAGIEKELAAKNSAMASVLATPKTSGSAPTQTK
jgi:hypothetical protein